MKYGMTHFKKKEPSMALYTYSPKPKGCTKEEYPLTSIFMEVSLFMSPLVKSRVTQNLQANNEPRPTLFRRKFLNLILQDFIIYI